MLRRGRVARLFPAARDATGRLWKRNTDLGPWDVSGAMMTRQIDFYWLLDPRPLRLHTLADEPAAHGFGHVFQPVDVPVGG